MYDMKSIMKMAWRFVKQNGFTMSEALKTAWANARLKMKMAAGIVKFAYRKIDGTLREAYGTLASRLVPETGNGRKPNDSVQVYYDTEKMSWRSFKVANLVRVA